MLRHMPCGKEEVVHNTDHEEEAGQLVQRLLSGDWFGFAKIDIEIPEHLHQIFKKVVPAEVAPQQTLDYLKRTRRNRGNGRKLVGVLSTRKILVYASVLRWYLNHGARASAVYRTIDYVPRKIFPWIVGKGIEARRTGDVHKDKALLAEVFKVLGEQWVRKAHRSVGAANQQYVHER